MLLKGLPPTALSRTPAERRGVDEPWTAVHELLAQLIEVTSVPAAEMRLNEPITVPRPGRPTADPAEPGAEVVRAVEQPGSNPFRRAIAAMQPQPRKPSPARDIEEESA